MSEVFRTVLNAGFQGSIVIAAVLLLRLVLNRVPRKYICLLWILAGIRLLMPFSVESPLSLQPEEEIVSQQQWQDLRDYGEILPEDTPMEMPQPHVPQTDEQLFPEEQQESEVITRTALSWAVVLWIWLAGVGSMGVYSLVSWLLLKRRVREAVHLADDIWECSGLGTAFIMGFLRPRIYIPINISPESRRHILMHERCHLNRFDHWAKLGAFIALTIHWFNPVVWVFYLLLCRDIEMACDEAAVRDMSLEERKGYSAALLECSAGRMRWAVCPVAFGEVSVKQRILGVLHYRRPRFWLTILGAAAIVFVVICFMTSPLEQRMPTGNDEWEDKIWAVLEEIQSRDAVHILEQRYFAGENVLNDSADVNFFRHGEVWMTLVYIDDMEENGWTGYLGGGDHCFEAVSDGTVFNWQETKKTEDQEPWLYAFDMDAQDAAVISRKNTNEGYELRLKVFAPYHELGESYHVDFCFDQEGNFRNASLYASGMVDGFHMTITSVMTAPEVSWDTVDRTIAQYTAGLEREYDIFLGIATLDVPAWGITLETDHVTPEGLRLSITQSGTLVMQELYYGQDFQVERWNRETWEAVEPVIENWGFTMEAIQLPQNQTTRLEIDWEWLYGQLPAGTYRIGKSIHNDVRVPVGVNPPRVDPPEEQNYTYYAVFEITDGTDGVLFERNTLGTLLEDWNGEIAYACLRSEVGVTSLSGMRESAEVMAMLKHICYDPNRASQVSELRDVDEYRWYYSSIEFSNGEYLIFGDDFENVWAINAAGTTAVYEIENPLAIQTFFAKSFDGVVGKTVIVEPFADGEEPWLWAKKICMDAVEEARLYVAEKSAADGNTVSVSSNSGIVSVSRFEELLDILNDLEKDDFVAKDILGNHSLSTIRSDFGDEQGLTVTITDGANQETVVLRMVAGDVDLIFCGNLAGIRHTDYLNNLHCWTVDNEILLLYLLEWMEHPSTIYYWPETG